MIKFIEGDFINAEEANKYIKSFIDDGFCFLVKEMSSIGASGFSRSGTHPNDGIGILEDGIRLGRIALSNSNLNGDKISVLSVVKTPEYEEYLVDDVDQIFKHRLDMCSDNNFIPLSPLTYGYQVTERTWEYSYYFTRSANTYGTYIVARNDIDSSPKTGRAIVSFEVI